MNSTEKLVDMHKKVVIMQSLLEKDQVRQPADERVNVWTHRVLSQAFSGYDLLKRDNLIDGIKRAHQLDKTVILTPRHESDYDHIAARFIFDKEGLRDFADNTIWIAGVNMLKRRGISIFMRAEEVIYIATPDDLKTAEKFEDRQAMEIFRAINNRALDLVKKAQREERKNLGIYPEAGRSYDGFMKQAPVEVSAYFPRGGSAVVIPYRLYGPREINPPNKLFRFDKFIPGFRQHLTMIAGEAYCSSEVWQWVRGREIRTANPAKWVMANLANLDPKDIRPEELSEYQTLLVTYAPQRCKISL